MTPEERRLLRWYPQDWTERYGPELLAMVEDTTGGELPGIGMRMSLMVAGLRERLRSGGYIGADRPASWRSRAGALLVLAAWATLVVGGSDFAKATEHWSDGAAGHRGGAVAAAAYTAVMVGAAVGALAVAAGAVMAVPAWWRSIRTGSGAAARRPLAWAGAAVLLAAAATAGLAFWAHHLSSAQRNGGMAWYGAAFLAWGLTVVAAIMAATRAAFAVERRLDISVGIVRLQAGAALAATVAIVTATAAMLTWWVARLVVTGGAPSGAAGGAPGATVSWPLALASALAVGATVVAALGSGRIIGARRELTAGS